MIGNATIGARDMFGPVSFDSFLMISEFARNFKAKDPRDKVFGVLGLLDPLLLPTSFIDYTKSLATVYEDTIMSLISGENTDVVALGILNHVNHSENYNGNDGFKSWVPRWDLDDCLRWEIPLRGPPARRNQWYPSLDVKPKFVARNLDVQGILVDQIKSVKPKM